jgi:hypothetical protein
MENSEAGELKKAYRIAVVIAVITVASFLLFAWLVHLIDRRFDPFDGLFPLIKGDTLKFILLGITVAISLIIRLIKSVLPSGRITIRLPRQVTGRLKISSDTVQRLLLTSVITFALCELVAAFGVAVFLVTGYSLDFYIFLVMSLLLMATNFPLRREWEESVKKYDKQAEQEQKAAIG